MLLSNDNNDNSSIIIINQNRPFNTNQRQLFKELHGKLDNSQLGPEPAEARTFWGGLWDQPEWLADVKDELKNVQREGFQIDVNKVKKQLRKVPNWKAPGPD